MERIFWKLSTVIDATNMLSIIKCYMYKCMNSCSFVTSSNTTYVRSKLVTKRGTVVTSEQLYTLTSFVRNHHGL